MDAITQFPALAAPAATFVAVYKVFGWIEETSSPTAKRDLFNWLMGWRNHEVTQSVSTSVVSLHSKLFGEKQFSIKCALRTLAWSFLAIAIAFSSALSIYKPRSVFGEDCYFFACDFDTGCIHHLQLPCGFFVCMVYAARVFKATRANGAP